MLRQIRDSKTLDSTSIAYPQLGLLEEKNDNGMSRSEGHPCPCLSPKTSLSSLECFDLGDESCRELRLATAQRKRIGSYYLSQLSTSISFEETLAQSHAFRHPTSLF